VSVAGDFKSGVRTIIKTLGSDCAYQRSGGSIETIRIAITSIPKDQGELINAVGIDGSMGYLLHTTPEPVKFDQVTTPTGTIFTVHHASEILVAGSLIGYKIGLKK
jgi:NAD(P)H-flavin reductase